MSESGSPSPRRGLDRIATANYSSMLTSHGAPPTTASNASPSTLPLGGDAGGAPPASSGGAANKAKALEEFLNAFPIEHPESAGSLRERLEAEHGARRRGGGGAGGTGGGAAAGTGGAGGGDRLDNDLRRYEREQTQKRAGREAVKNKLGTNIRRQRIETWVQLSEKNNTKLRRENEALERIATLTQENCLDNDHRFEEAIGSLRAELEFATVYRQDNSETLQYIREAVGSIQDRISQMRVASQHQSQLEFENIREAFERQLEQQTRQLEEVRESGKSTTGEWKAKNEVAQAQLEDALLRTDAAYHRFKELSSKNSRLRVEHDAQESDSVLLEKQFRLVSAHHQRLKDRLHDLEVELSSEPPARRSSGGSPTKGGVEGREEDLLAAISDVQRGLGGSGGGFGANRTSIEAKQNEYKRSLAKAQALLEQEASNLRAVRHAHILALRQRTELEVFLRQAVVNHRRNKAIEKQENPPTHDNSGMAFITNRPPFNTAGTRATSAGQKQLLNAPPPRLHSTAFTAEDRREVVDALLANKRVLQLLYADPNEAERMHRAVEPRSLGGGGGGGGGRSLEEDVEALWKKWKAWTEAANTAFGGEAYGEGAKSDAASEGSGGPGGFSF